MNRKEKIAEKLQRIFVDDSFDTKEGQKVILGPFPDYEGYQKKLDDVKSQKILQRAPTVLAPCYERPLLTTEQERHMFRLMNYYKYLAQKSFEKKRLKQAENNLLLAENIRNEITLSNMRLAVKIVNYKEEPNEDSLSKAYTWTMKAVDYFDWRRGIKFSTYCCWVVKKNHWHELSLERKYLSSFLPLDDEENILGRNLDYSDEKKQEHYEQLVRKLLKVLPKREKEVIEARFGIKSKGNGSKLVDVGKKMGISKERVRQIQRRGMLRLKEAAIEKGIKI